MPRVIVKTDDGDTVWEHNFPLTSMYALVRMPSCPTHLGLNSLLNGLKRALGDAEVIQRGGDPRRLSERVMEAAEEETTGTFRVVRHFRDDDRSPALVGTGLTFKQARDHCAGPDRQGDGWHDSYEAEGS